MTKIYIIKIVQIVDNKLTYVVPGVYRSKKLAEYSFKEKTEEVLNQSSYDLISLYSLNEDFDDIVELKIPNGDYFKSSLDELNSHEELHGYLKAIDLSANDVLEDTLELSFKWE